jgi:hypothetical protein
MEEIKARLDKAMEAVKEAARKLTDEPDQPAVTEDAFAPPPDQPKQEEPPKDPVVGRRRGAAGGSDTRAAAGQQTVSS